MLRVFRKYYRINELALLKFYNKFKLIYFINAKTQIQHEWKKDQQDVTASKQQ